MTCALNPKPCLASPFLLILRVVDVNDTLERNLSESEVRHAEQSAPPQPLQCAAREQSPRDSIAVLLLLLSTT